MAGRLGSAAHSRAECSFAPQRSVCRRFAAFRGPAPICKATGKDSSTVSNAQDVDKRKLSGTFDVVAEDLQYIQQATGLDLSTSFSTMKEAHEQVVSLLNPIIGEKVEQEIEEQIHSLQASLQHAHKQVHASEDLLINTVQQLSELEASANSIRFASADDGQQAQPSTSTSASATSHLSQQAQSAPQQHHHPAQPTIAEQRRYSSQTKRRRLHSSLALPSTLHQFWYPAEFSAQLKKRSLMALELFHEPWVVFRGADGKAACVRDTCAHRACPLSLGQVVDGQVQCPYHGWRYNGQGVCTSMPSTAHVPGVTIDSLPVAEADGFVWVWLGQGAPPPLPQVAKPPSGFQVHAELQLEVPVDHGLLLENLLDLAHAPFTHTTTFAKGWPVPDVVKFKAAQLLGGNWEPYPIDMSFEPPCMVLSTIGLTQPGKIERGARAASCRNHLHQLHVCLPAGPGRTRLLYRMSMDFLGWARHVPFIEKFWSQIAGQVLGEDLVLVAGQQDRLQRGADVWGHPVAYDKLAVRYRRWRNSLHSNDEAERAEAAAALNKPLSAGELFALEREQEAQNPHAVADQAQA